MNLSSIIINRIKKADIHFDLKSFEENTKEINKKYKIYSTRYLTSFIFFLFMTDKMACASKFRLCVASEDILNRKHGYLENKFSYVDASKPDILTEDKIIEKINDPQNRFKYIGKLKNKKFKHLIYLLKTSQYYSSSFSRQRIEIIDNALNCIAKEKMEKLGLE